MNTVRPNDGRLPGTHTPLPPLPGQVEGARGLAHPAAVLALVALWALAHLLLRGLLSPVIGTDDMMENVLAQTLEPGYSLRQPPLYEWLLWSLQQVVGPTIWSFLLLKYALLLGAAACLLALARRAMPPLTAAFCLLSFSALYQLGWNLHEGVTHTVVLVAASAATALALVRALTSGRLADYLLVGLALGAGLLAKHSFALFALALALAVLSDRHWRSRLSPGGLALAGAAAALVYSPYLAWVLAQPSGLVGETASVMVTEEVEGHVIRAVTGLGRLGWSLFGFLMPFLGLVLLLFWQPLRQGLTAGRSSAPGADRSAQDRPAPDRPAQDRPVLDGSALDPVEAAAVARLCGRTVALAIGLTAAGILLSGATYVKERHMHALLLLLPLWLFARIGTLPARGRRLLGLSLLGLALVAFAARVPGLVAPERLLCGGACRHMKPYDQLKPELSALGAAGATLVGDDDYTAGNLRVLFPQARIVGPSWRPDTPPRAVCLLVWEAGEGRPELAAAEDVTRRFPALAAADLAAEPRFIAAGWPHLWLERGHRVTTFGVALLVPSSPMCQ
ncbi:glycosyltransferase family 39 protein [Pannonibacter tanglangensis]|uniref:Glycosyltransferase RgtA/B/C/D-like domain-containing protein n=1 Tax=Pannonibacter tanglangensis TaxID=2750084 RepID=A0ABW9ZG20_9HYPH|nr:glycosyltransferase family 39 protein [Pannonibacter sp. XCT-34]NBN63792.1 hypothetical protein [Pannonibacter sp. XCT-34]